jgi:hypothetical protein
MSVFAPVICLHAQLCFRISFFFSNLDPHRGGPRGRWRRPAREAAEAGENGGGGWVRGWLLLCIHLGKKESGGFLQTKFTSQGGLRGLKC